jgi:hypothetical protein
LILGGPAAAASSSNLLPADVAAWIFVGCLPAGLLIYFAGATYTLLRDLNRYVSLCALGISTVVWLGLAAMVAFEFGFPAPNETSYFAAAAQINATLLIAGVINSAPAAWLTTRRIHLTWMLTAPTIAVIGLGASVAGSISTRGSAALFVLSISPVGPIAVALMLGAYDQVVRRRSLERRSPTDAVACAVECEAKICQGRSKSRPVAPVEK